MNQPALPFDVPRQRAEETFDGETFSQERDGQRLTFQLDRVREWALRQEWFTLAGAHEALGYPEASISARLRDLRKQRFGAYMVSRVYRDNGLFEYRVRP